MLENREKKKVLQIYDEPIVQICVIDEKDVLTASTDTGEEYPEMWG